MKKKDRYDTSDLIENQFQPGSRKRVLKNLLGITTKKEMELAESEAYLRVFEYSAGIYSKDHRFCAKDLCDLHHVWLKDIYEWAGRYRRVNISKEGFPFAMAAYIPRRMNKFEKDTLAEFTPCSPGTLETVAEALAVTHVEFVLIHPFREGNGRLARLLSFLMALQADMPPPDFSEMAGHNLDRYIAAIHAGMYKDYEPMMKIFMTILQRSMSKAGRL